jgi:hypothetical protein
MRTIEDILCTCEPHVAGNKTHWVWLGAVKRSDRVPVCAAPNLVKDPSGETLSIQSVRRAIWHILTGVALPPEIGAYQKCRVKDCVAPECTAYMTKKAYGKFATKTERDRGSLRRKLASQRRWSGKRKITREIADNILSDKRRAKDIAGELKVHPSSVTRVRRGEYVGPTGNMFAGLMR